MPTNSADGAKHAKNPARALPATKRNLTADDADTRGSIRTKNDKKIRDKKITGPVNQALEKS
jgi:hypothetical protein